MTRLVDFLFGVRKEEVGLAAILFSGYGLILLTYFFLKPARDSLFLAGPGPANLPVVFVLIALVALPVTLLYGRLARILDLSRLIKGTSAVLIGCLLLLRWLLALELWWIYYAFYVWVGIYGILTTSQFWLFANSVLDSTQAKRIFGVVNLGGILGAIIGGETASFLVGVLEVSTRDLLLFCAGFLALSAILLSRVGGLGRRDSRATATAAPFPEPVRNSLREVRSMIRDHRHLAGIGGLLSLTMLVATLVDFQFKTVAVAAYPDQQALAAFLGKFYGRLSMVSLLLQTFLTYRLIRFWGVSGAILLLPFGTVAHFVGHAGGAHALGCRPPEGHRRQPPLPPSTRRAGNCSSCRFPWRSRSGPRCSSTSSWTDGRAAWPGGCYWSSPLSCTFRSTGSACWSSSWRDFGWRWRWSSASGYVGALPGYEWSKPQAVQWPEMGYSRAPNSQEKTRSGKHCGSSGSQSGNCSRPGRGISHIYILP